MKVRAIYDFDAEGGTGEISIRSGEVRGCILLIHATTTGSLGVDSYKNRRGGGMVGR